MVIPEEDLFGLADLPAGPPARPVDGVIARGGRLRRRRHAVRALGVTAVVGGVAAAGTLMAGGDGDRADDVQVGATSSTTAAAPALLPNPMSCLVDGDGRTSFVPPTAIARAEVPEAMRLIPTQLPEDAPITVAQGARYDFPPSDCGPVAEMVDTLVLAASGPDGGVSATVRVSGPYSTPSGDLGLSYDVPSQLRGRPATMAVNGVDVFVIFTWGEPDGGYWELRAEGIDEAGARAVAEALQLDSSPDPGQPPAQIPPEALPAGFQVVAQAATVPGPAPEPDVGPTWTVQVGESAAVQTGFMCHLEVREAQGAGFDGAAMGIGDRVVTVGGRDALWGPVMGSSPATHPEGVPMNDLTWEPAPGYVARMDCEYWDGPAPGTLPLEQMVAIAESVATVAPDDPRLPPE